MAVASLVLSILSLLLSWIPIFNIVALFPCLLSFIFGIIGVAKNKSNKAMSITGIIISILTFAIIAFITFFSWIFVQAIGSIGESSNFDMKFGNNNFHYEYKGDKHLNKTYSINEDIKFIDRVIKVEKIEKSQENDNYKPDTGNEFILVTISMKNISTHDILYNCDNFNLLDESNQRYETDFNKINSNSTFTKGSIKPGKVVTGILCFEVSKNTKNLTLQYRNGVNSVNILLK